MKALSQLVYTLCAASWLLLPYSLHALNVSKYFTVSKKKSASSPIKVFLLAGQSNMVGMGSMKHMDELVRDPDINEFRDDLWNGTAYKVRCDVRVQFDENRGCLTLPGFASGGRMGPEVGMGWVLGGYFKRQQQRNGTPKDKQQPIVFIKTAWGGKSLAVDFRPPSSGPGTFTRVKPLKYGVWYDIMIQDIKNALRNLGLIYPDYNPQMGYELAGFVWFQGWNDVIYWPYVKEYEYNLANLIRDVRADLDAPNMPFIVGELGMHGLTPTGKGTDRAMYLRASERNVTLMPEFVSNTKYVPTSPFVVLNATEQYGYMYHYGARADTYYHIGKAFGYALIKFLNKRRNA
jgi:Carbohydrate esterase, sialic acid-specific acetylesterase